MAYARGCGIASTAGGGGMKAKSAASIRVGNVGLHQEHDVAGNFSAFWMGLCIMALMFLSYYFSQHAALMALMPAKFACRCLRSRSRRMTSFLVSSS